MVGDLISGQEDTQKPFDLPQAHAHGEGRGRELLELVLVEEDVGASRRLRRGDCRGTRLLIGWGLWRRLIAEPLFELAGVLVDGLAAAAGLLGLAGDGAVPTREDGGGVEDSGANG